MALLMALLPLYLLGNLHCIGMCGPLVLMIGRHRYRYLYFFGRILSFALVGALAGGIGAVTQLLVKRFDFPAMASFFFGGIIFLIGLQTLFGWRFLGSERLSRWLGKISNKLALLILRDQPLTTFLFGFFTVFLPCGQTLMVFSGCALAGSAAVGLLNGFAFSLLTSPSLLLAMHAHGLLSRIKKHYNVILGLCGIIVGGLTICRGLADLGVIDHLVFNSEARSLYHIVLF